MQKIHEKISSLNAEAANLLKSLQVKNMDEMHAKKALKFYTKIIRSITQIRIKISILLKQLQKYADLNLNSDLSSNLDLLSVGNKNLLKNIDLNTDMVKLLSSGIKKLKNNYSIANNIELNNLFQDSDSLNNKILNQQFNESKINQCSINFSITNNNSNTHKLNIKNLHKRFDTVMTNKLSASDIYRKKSFVPKIKGHQYTPSTSELNSNSNKYNTNSSNVNLTIPFINDLALDKKLFPSLDNKQNKICPNLTQNNPSNKSIFDNKKSFSLLNNTIEKNIDVDNKQFENSLENAQINLTLLEPPLKVLRLLKIETSISSEANINAENNELNFTNKSKFFNCDIELSGNNNDLITNSEIDNHQRIKMDDSTKNILRQKFNNFTKVNFSIPKYNKFKYNVDIINIIISIINGKDINIKIKKDLTILELKESINQIENIPIENQILFYNKYMLLDSQFLEFFGIGNGSKILLNIL